MSRKALPEQIPLPFIAELDKQLAEEKERERESSKRANAAYRLKNWIENDPPTAYEWDIMTMGIRLCMFVDDYLECQHCNLGDRDHTVGWLFSTKICLKDYYRKCKEWGIKPYIPQHDRWDKSLIDKK